MATYSHTRLSAFETCPRKFYYQYRAKVQVDEEEGIEGFLGTLVHDALEKLYRDGTYGRILTADQLAAHFDAQWEKKHHDGITIVRKDYQPEDYRHVGRECLRRYHARYHPFDQTVTLALEEKVTVSLDGSGKYNLAGFIDRLSQASDGTFEIHDYKTNSRLPTQADKDQDRQLALYQMGVMERWPDVPGVVLIWHFVRHDREIRSSRTPGDLEALRQQTIALIDDIESREDEDEFPTQESALCGWCQYRQLCPCQKHESLVANLSPNRFLKEPGVALVNRLSMIKAKKAELKGQIAALDQEYAEVEEALLKHAEANGIERVVGSSHEARIATQKQVIFPRKGEEPESYAVLEGRLRGSTFWSVVSMMDMSRLRRIWVGDEEDPGAVRSTLKSFVREEEGTKLSLRKRRCEEDE